MPVIIDISKEQAIKDRTEYLASEGCIQAERLKYGLVTCFDKLIKAQLEIEMLEEVPETDSPYTPGDPIPPIYIAPFCNFSLELVPSETPSGTRNGRLLLLPGQPYDFTATLKFFQKDAGYAILYMYLKNGSIIDSNGTVSNPPDTDIRPIVISHNFIGTIAIEGAVSYAEGSIKNDSNAVPSPAGHILAGITSCGNSQIEFDYPLYYGYLSITDAGGGIPDKTLLDDIGSLDSEIQFTQDWSHLVLPFNNLSDPGFLWFAVPASHPVYTTWFENVNNDGTIGSPGDFFEQYGISTVTFGTNSVQYRIYVSDNITEASSNYLIDV